MRHTITQEDGMGCGVACVAFVANTTYRQALMRLNEHQASTAGYHLKELVGALYTFGRTYKHKHAKKRSNSYTYPEGAIVFINRSKKYPYGHYLVRHDAQWMDPWINILQDEKVGNAKSGYRQRLPGQAQWIILPV
jgi:hypothetical protein